MLFKGYGEGEEEGGGRGLVEICYHCLGMGICWLGGVVLCRSAGDFAWYPWCCIRAEAGGFTC